MPLYRYKCPECGRKIQKFLVPEAVKFPQRCPDDDHLLIRTPEMASAQVKEVVDPGFYARRVEIIKK